MGILEILLIGLALSMDAFAVTVSNTFCYRGSSKAQRIAMPVMFGFFQGLMPVLGFFAGSFAADIINQYAGIVTLIILGAIGGKMLKDGIDALKRDEAETPSCSPAKTITFKVLILQAVATSIDAFAVGVSFCAAGANIAMAAPIVMITTLVCCFLALKLGNRFGVVLGDKAQIIGGIVLVLIGLKALFS